MVVNSHYFRQHDISELLSASEISIQAILADSNGSCVITRAMMIKRIIQSQAANGNLLSNICMPGTWFRVAGNRRQGLRSLMPAKPQRAVHFVRSSRTLAYCYPGTCIPADYALTTQSEPGLSVLVLTSIIRFASNIHGGRGRLRSQSRFSLFDCDRVNDTRERSTNKVLIGT